MTVVSTSDELKRSPDLIKKLVPSVDLSALKSRLDSLSFKGHIVITETISPTESFVLDLTISG